MEGYIGDYNFKEMEAQKYYAPPGSWSQDKKIETARTRIFSGEWYGAEKKDGYFAQFLKDDDGNIFLLSRSRNVKGEFPNKYNWVPHLHDFFDQVPNGTCFLGELYLPSKPGSRNITTILGCLEEKAIVRQKDEKLHFYIFDCLASQGVSFINEPAHFRFQMLESLSLKSEYKHDNITIAKYYNGEQLWEKLQYYLAEGKEGVVITNKNSVYKPGKRSVKDTLKIKKELQETIDCFFTGHFTPPTKEYTGKEIETWTYWEDLKTGEKINNKCYKEYNTGRPIIPITKSYYNNWAGSLEIGVIRNDKVVPIGLISGLTEEIKANPLKYKGKCIEVGAMEIEETGGLRHAKLLQFRPDLTIQDCQWGKIFE